MPRYLIQRLEWDWGDEGKSLDRHMVSFRWSMVRKRFFVVEGTPTEANQSPAEGAVGGDRNLQLRHEHCDLGKSS